MKTDTSDKMISYISEKKQASPKELADFLLISPQALFRQLKKLQEQGLIAKIGRPPRVLYSLASSPIKEQALITWKAGEKTIIDREFLHVTPRGELLFGAEGFVAWCYERKLDPQKIGHEYVATLQKYDQFKKNGLIDGLPKMKTTFAEVFLDELYYLDFYSIERFGKTRLGTLLLLAKQTQDKTLMQQILP